jgi:hypothetical protein
MTERMALADLFNFPVQIESDAPEVIGPGGLVPTGSRTVKRTTTATQSTFITPQTLVAYPLASGLVATFWKGAERLFHLKDESLWVCFGISMFLAFFTYLISMNDPKLKTTRGEKWIGAGFAFINGFYLFTTAIGISTAIRH